MSCGKLERLTFGGGQVCEIKTLFVAVATG
jgi:hypothetical protein